MVRSLLAWRRGEDINDVRLRLLDTWRLGGEFSVPLRGEETNDVMFSVL